MAWRNPKYAYQHALRDIGTIWPVVPDGTPDVDYVAGDEKYLFDDRMSTLFKWITSAAGHMINVNRGVGPWSIDRLYIPFGHNLNGAKLLVQTDTLPAFSSPTTLYGPTLVSGTDPIDVTLTSSTEQFLRVSFPDNAGAWEIGQLWVTTTVTLSVGIEPFWVDELRPNVLRFPDDSTVQQDPDQRFVEYVYSHIGDTAADLTAMEALIAAISTHRPFILDSAYDDSSGGFTKVMKLASGARVRHDDPVRSSKRKKRIVLPMLEYLL
jgi:hypothetical protein